MNRLITAVAACCVLGVATNVAAKDPYNPIGDLVGNKAMYTKYIWGESNAQKVEFMWLGATDLWLVSSAGVTDVTNVGFGSGTFEWIGPFGYTHRIDDYPYDNGGATVAGGIYKGNTLVGKFSIASVKADWEPASGRWAGELAFPGSSLPIALEIADLSQPTYGGCRSLATRVDFLGHGYQDTTTLVCPGDAKDSETYYLSFFYFDERYGDSWFVSIESFYSVFKTGDLLQSANVSMFEITGMGQWLLGKMVTSRPERFGY